MTHPDGARLNDYADGLLEEGAAADLEAHLVDCERCRERVAALRRLTARLDALPRAIPPRRDVRPTTPAPARGRPWIRAAAAVAVGVGIGAAAWLGLFAPPESAPDGAAGDPVISAYTSAAAELTAQLRPRKTELDPAAARALDTNLATVDAAIREVERAQARRDDGALDRHLEARLRTKLALLRSAMRLLEAS